LSQFVISAIKIDEVLDLNLDFDFDLTIGVLLHYSRDKSLLLFGLLLYIFLFFLILSNNVVLEE